MFSSTQYRLFGDLLLDVPTASHYQQYGLERLDAHFRSLELEQKSRSWHWQKAFEQACQQEVAAWKEYGEDRDERFLLPPEGPIQARLSCHLHNPNFNVSNPFSTQTADDTNPSICQLLQAGFTPDKVLIYDHTFRRDPVDPLTAYPPDILKIHEDFTYELRNNMSAVVDVVWGAPVRERMKRAMSLEEFKLWGQYEGVSIFLEWDKAASKLKRFIVFVRHPESMAYADTATIGKIQDQHLQVAAKLAQVEIAAHFYEQAFQRGQYVTLSLQGMRKKRELNETAIAQLQNIADRAFEALPTSAHLKRNRIPFAQRQYLRQYPDLLDYFSREDTDALAQHTANALGSNEESTSVCALFVLNASLEC